jgi:SDR family mycofactocin-dependent oxidoreductase
MGKLEGRVAFITGAARGQGRCHAVQLAREGADVIGVDVCAQNDSVAYAMSTPEDLVETARAVEGEGRRFVGRQADVRDLAALERAIEEGTEELGAVDVIVANAGIAALSMDDQEREWDEVIGVNLTGVYHTVRAALPSMLERGRGGSIVLISSTAGLVGVGGNSPGMLAYTASKHGVIGLTRSWANYLAPHNIRVNSVAPGGVRTPMLVNDALPKFVKGHPEFAGSMGGTLPGNGVVEPEDISSAVVWLASDSARYVTGVVLPVDAGAANKR